MNIKRNAGGYTLLELVMAVGIIAVLMGIGAVNVVRYQRILTRTEYDGIAREIFVAAQNHLTMAESQGFLGIPKNGDENQVGKPYEAGKTDICYYVVNDALRNTLYALNAPPNMLNLMLPFASVDETARNGGSYVIRYQREPALVLDVFYAAQSGRFPYTFKPKDEANPDGAVNPQWIRDYSGEGNAQKRERYPDGTGDNVIGWYGSGGQSIPKGTELQAPVIKVINAETLYVEVTNPNGAVVNAGLRLVITGAQSEKEAKIDLIDKDGVIKVGSDKAKFAPVPLDDVTSKDKRFYKVCAGLYPGEDITVRAEAYNNHELTNIATSASVMTNSLFASLDKDSTFPLNGYNAFSARISNFRHLENLDCGISAIKFEGLGSSVVVNGKQDPYYYILESGKTSIITRAEQTGDMDWVKFKTAVGNDNASVYYGETASKAGCYLPVTNGGKTVANGGNIPYDGKGFKISNVKIDVEGNAGLFATLGNESAISNVSNLELWNFNVTSSGGAAGVLAGIVQGCNVSGVLAAHETDKTSEIKGKTSVGGLVGEVKGTSTVTQSAAAVYVVSDNGDAGGLIGSVASNGNATVSDSYAGGHTKDGDYEKNRAEKSRYNVKGSTNAGGLIGNSAGNLTVTNCYATTSAEGGNAGGLIGSVTKGTITKCYVTGAVSGNSGHEGALAGASGTAATFTKDCYFSIINEAKNPLIVVGDANVTDSGAFDSKLGATNEEGTYLYYATYKNGAKPYDFYLTQYYEGKYMFRTVSELATYDTAENEKAPNWIKTHYGDWPAPETQVINKPGS